MANINVSALSNALATAIQQVASQVAISSPATTNATAMTIVTQPSTSSVITTGAAPDGQFNSPSSTP